MELVYLIYYFKVYERQVNKESLAARVVDEQQVGRHFSRHDTELLYKFAPKMLVKPVPLVPKDKLLAEFLREGNEAYQFIVNYHEHDSLLTSRPDENLTVCNVLIWTLEYVNRR